MKIRISNLIIPSIPTAILLVLLCTLSWFSSYFGARFATPTFSSFAVQFLQTFLLPNSLLSNVVSFCFTLVNAFLLVQLNNKFSIIRTRTFLPILIFLLLISTWHETHTSNGSHLSLSFFIISFFYIFEMYRNTKAVEQAFMSTFFVSLSSIIIAPYIFLVPVYWIGFVQLKGFSIKTFAASIFGAIAPWIFYFSIAFYHQPDMKVFDFISHNTLSFLDFNNIQFFNLIYIAIIGIIAIICLVGMFATYNRDSISARNKLSFLVVLLVSTSTIAVVFESQSISLLPLIGLCFAVLTSHSFTLKKSNFYSILFFIFIAVNIGYIISNYFS